MWSIVWLMLVRYIEDTMHVRIPDEVISYRETIYNSLSDVERISITPPIELQPCLSAIVSVPQPVITMNPFPYPLRNPMETLSNIVRMN